MTEEELADAARLMAESQDRLRASYDRFVAAVLRHTDMMMSSIEGLKAHEEVIDLHMKRYDARLDFLKSIQEALASLAPALSDAAVSWNENNDHLKKLTQLLEAHLGSSEGLEFEN